MSLNQYTYIYLISKGDSAAKYNVETLELVENSSFKKSELRMIEYILEENQEIIVEWWNEYFKKKSDE